MEMICSDMLIYLSKLIPWLYIDPLEVIRDATIFTAGICMELVHCSDTKYIKLALLAFIHTIFLVIHS